MTLTTHSIIAAAVTKPFLSYNPIAVFLLALASHYIADAIPHWDYSLRAVENKENPDLRAWSNNRSLLIKDLMRFGLDGLLGAAIVITIMQPISSAQWFGVAAMLIGGSLPDFLQGLYITRKFSFLGPLQHFHNRMHTKIKLGPYPLIGIPLQIAIVLVALYALS